MPPASTRASLIRSRLLALLVGIALAVPFAVSSPASGPVLAADAAAPGGRLIVVWKSDAAQVRGLRTRVVGMERVARRISLVTAPAGRAGRLAATLRADPGVASVVPDAVVSIDAWPSDGSAPNDEFYDDFQNDLDVIRMREAWRLTTGSTSIVVAVLDTGFTAHTDFDSSAVVHPRNAIDGNSNVADGNGHGTHVAGTIAARANNGAGIAGVAPNVSLMPVKVLDNTGNGSLAVIATGVDWARTHGASVINLSLGGYLTSGQASAVRPVFDAAINAGIVIVAAAGNDGADHVSNFYPAAYPRVLAVGSTTNTDARSSFSNAGPPNFISAPGNTIRSLRNDGSGYVSMSGTSMSTPHVVGAVALIRSLHPSLSVASVANALCVTSVDLGSPGRDEVFGCGRLDVFAALAYRAPPKVKARP
jgi:subtilisin family serine protease